MSDYEMSSSALPKKRPSSLLQMVRPRDGVYEKGDRLYEGKIVYHKCLSSKDCHGKESMQGAAEIALAGEKFDVILCYIPTRKDPDTSVWTPPQVKLAYVLEVDRWEMKSKRIILVEYRVTDTTKTLDIGIEAANGGKPVYIRELENATVCRRCKGALAAADSVHSSSTGLPPAVSVFRVPQPADVHRQFYDIEELLRKGQGSVGWVKVLLQNIRPMWNYTDMTKCVTYISKDNEHKFTIECLLLCRRSCMLFYGVCWNPSTMWLGSVTVGQWQRTYGRKAAKEWRKKTFEASKKKNWEVKVQIQSGRDSSAGRYYNRETGAVMGKFPRHLVHFILEDTSITTYKAPTDYDRCH